MIDDLKNDAQTRMIKTLESLKTELAKIRTGRAHPSLLEHLTVEYYGSAMPLSQVASVSATDARTLSITPWEKTMVQAIEKAIMTSDLGLNPATSGTTIRVPMPALTEERRRDLTKVVRQEGEAARVAIRNIRRDINSDLKNLLKDKAITEDDERRGNDIIQKMTDKYIQEVDKALEVKEADLMAV